MGEEASLNADRGQAGTQWADLTSTTAAWLVSVRNGYYGVCCASATCRRSTEAEKAVVGFNRRVRYLKVILLTEQTGKIKWVGVELSCARLGQGKLTRVAFILACKRLFIAGFMLVFC